MGVVYVDGKADALTARDDRGVYAHDLSPHVGQRAAAVARVDGGVRLNQVDDGMLPVRYGPPQGAHDSFADGRSAPESECVANGDHVLPDLQVGGRAQLRGMQALRNDGNDRHVGRRITTNQTCLMPLAVAQSDRYGAGTLYNVAAGEDVARGVDNHARPDSLSGDGSVERAYGNLLIGYLNDGRGQYP